MAVKHQHLDDYVQVWDGNCFATMHKDEAAEKEAVGVLQITTNLRAADLKTRAELTKNKPSKAAQTKVVLPPGVEQPTEPKGKGGRKPKGYSTRQMKAE